MKSFSSGFSLTRFILPTRKKIPSCGSTTRTRLRPGCWFAAALIASSLTACGGGGGGGSSGSTNYQPALSGWTQLFGSGAKGVNFNFPAAPGSVQYVVEPPPHAVSLGQTVTLKFNLIGNGTFGVKDPSDAPPAKVTLLLWRKGDNLTGQGAYETYREYCVCRTVITSPGTYTVSILLTPSNWTGVFGKTPSAGDFQALLNNLYAVGFTFGGNSYAGHGLFAASGSIQFQFIGYTIQ